jgi:hypothetical protein
MTPSEWTTRGLGLACVVGSVAWWLSFFDKVSSVMGMGTMPRVTKTNLLSDGRGPGTR